MGAEIKIEKLDVEILDSKRIFGSTRFRLDVRENDDIEKKVQITWNIAITSAKTIIAHTFVRYASTVYTRLAIFHTIVCVKCEMKQNGKTEI